MNPGGFPNQMNFMGMGGMPGANVISASPMITGKKVNNPTSNTPLMNPTASMPTMPNQILSGIFPGLIPGLIPGFGVPGTSDQQNPKSQKDDIDPALKKVFVKNIPPEVPDTFMESILKECGNIVQWKRTKNEKDIPMTFGTCEFENVEGVLRCLRIMNNLNILNEYLQIKPSDKTEKFLGEWSEMKMRDWSQTHKSNKQEDFEKYLQKDDSKSLERIHALIDNFDLNKIKLAKQKEEERKYPLTPFIIDREHPRERERAQEKRDYERDMKRKYEKKLQEWLREEERMERERKREKDRDREFERDREKEKYRLLDRELDFDSDEEKRRKANPKYQKNYEDRKKVRQREIQEDEEERRKELLAEQEKAMAIEREKAAVDIEPPMGNIMPDSDSDSGSEISEEIQKPKPKKEPKLVFQPLGEEHREHDTRETSGQGRSFELNIGTKDRKKQAGAIQAEEDEEKPEENHPYQQKKFKVSHNIKQLVETKQNIVQIDPHKKEATITFGVTTLAPTAKTDENQKMLNELQGLIAKIPKTKKDLFDYKVNWTLLAKSDLIEKKIKPWLCKQSEQYIGEQEVGFVNMILKKLANQENPQRILDRVKDLLDEDAEDFTMKLWRMLIFELLKLESLSNQ